MKKIFAFLQVGLLVLFPLFTFAQRPSFPDSTQLRSPQNPRLGFVLHGGAGVITRGSMSPEREAEYRKKLEEAVLTGYKALQDGKASLDAVEAAIRILEDSPLFNAGKGAVFTADGKNELDSSIMDGKTLAAGAVAGLHHIKNPISLARMVMEKSPHVMMSGNGAEQFAKEMGVEFVPEAYFWTPERWKGLESVVKEKGGKMPPLPKGVVYQSTPAKPAAKPARKPTSGYTPTREEIYAAMTPSQLEAQNKFGTVGAVALDKDGNLAAGTSTGGMTFKKYGRVGDAPIIGAGTYANNETCGVSATGWGEFFIRVGVARDISALMEYRGLPVQVAADMVMKKVGKLGGDGGVVAMDKFGNIAVSFNSEGMYRAYIDENGKPVVEIYK